MSKQTKRRAPSKSCPKCGKSIHARQMHHDCGWDVTFADQRRRQDDSIRKATKIVRKHNLRARKIQLGRVPSVNIDDIRAVKELVGRLGVDTVTAVTELVS